jgi:hypothetical protein
MDLVDENLKQCKLRARIVKKHAHSKSLLFVSVVFYNRELLVEVGAKYGYEDSYSLGSLVISRKLLLESDHCDSRLTVGDVVYVEGFLQNAHTSRVLKTHRASVLMDVASPTRPAGKFIVIEPWLTPHRGFCSFDENHLVTVSTEANRSDNPFPPVYQSIPKLFVQVKQQHVERLLDMLRIVVAPMLGDAPVFRFRESIFSIMNSCDRIISFEQCAQTAEGEQKAQPNPNPNPNPY